MTDVITQAVDHLLRDPYITPPHRPIRPIRPKCQVCNGLGYRWEWLRRLGDHLKVECDECGGRGRL